jgi:hypothetical protein
MKSGLKRTTPPRARPYNARGVVEAWNMIPGVIERSKTVSSFKNAYRRHREGMAEKSSVGIETETSQWRDHIRIQIHFTRPYIGHWT